MTNFLLVPEALVVAGAVALLLIGRFGTLRRRWRPYLPVATTLLVLAALLVELWAGAVVGSYLGGGLLEDRFALFAKVTALLAAGMAIAVADWSAEDSLSIGLSMPLIAAFGVMVAASAGDFVGLWAGVELAAAAGVVLVATRRPELGLRLLVIGGVASAMLLAGFAFLYAVTGVGQLPGMQQILFEANPTLPLAIPVLLLVSGLAVRAGLAPFHVGNVTGTVGASPVGAGLVLGLGATAAIVAAIKVTAMLSPLPAVFSPYLTLVAAVAMVGGGAAALAARSPRARLAYLAAGQVGWIAAGLVTHYRLGLGASLFLMGAFAVAATAGPAVMGGAREGEAGLAGMGALRPARAAGLTLALLSLAGAPPLAGVFGEFAVAAALGQSGGMALLALGLLGAMLSLAAAVATVRVIYFQRPPEEGRRGSGAALPIWTRFSAAGAIALCIVIGAYGLFGNPIISLANQGAEALGLR